MAGYSYALLQYYYSTFEVQQANTSLVSNDYFASTTNSYVDVARYNDSTHITLASHYSDNGSSYTYFNSENYMHRPMSNNMHALNLNNISSI